MAVEPAGTDRAGARSRNRPLTPGAGAALILRDATARLNGHTVWSDVSLRVGAGEFVAVLGPNGAGKSTLLKVILGLLPLAQGSVSVLDGPPRRANPRIGYLPQRRTFDAGTRVRGADLVRLGLDGARWGVPLPLPGRRGSRARAAERVQEALASVGADAYAERPIGELSGGEQQRLLIAQALVSHPEMLLLDEPLDSLDLPNQLSVARLVNDICRRRGVTVLLVAHDVNPLLPYVDRVIYFASGAALTGAVEEVVTTDSLTRLYGVPVEVLRTAAGRLVVVGQPDPPAHHSDRHAH
jgi:zinc/manganese transport system ATP-binding protein